MRKFASGVLKWIVSYVAVAFALILLPVFLITKDVSAFDAIMNYIFNNKS